MKKASDDVPFFGVANIGEVLAAFNATNVSAGACLEQCSRSLPSVTIARPRLRPTNSGEPCQG
jgi:hypothetical protein